MMDGDIVIGITLEELLKKQGKAVKEPKKEEEPKKAEAVKKTAKK